MIGSGRLHSDAGEIVMALQGTQDLVGSNGGSIRVAVTAFLTILAATLGLHLLQMVSADETVALVGLGLLASISLYGIGRFVGQRVHI